MNVGQHNMSKKCCEGGKRFCGLIRDNNSVLSVYGVGVSLYFKMLKVPCGGLRLCLCALNAF